MKQEYIRIITSELEKLNEDQLYKVLVLVKNTTSANANVSKEQHPSPNRSLIKVKAITDRLLLPASIKATDNVKKTLKKLGLTGGYGIFSVVGNDSDMTGRISSYVCFCIPDKVDGMIEIREISRNTITYIVSVRPVGSELISQVNVSDTEQVVRALESVVKKYK